MATDPVSRRAAARPPIDGGGAERGPAAGDAGAASPVDASVRSGAAQAAVAPADGPVDVRAEISRLASDLVPSLAAALVAGDLAELEIRQRGWRVRVRRNADGGAAADIDAAGARRRLGARAAIDRHAAERERGRSDARADGGESQRESRSSDGPVPGDAARPTGATSTNGTAAAGDDAGTRRRGERGDAFRVVATSPAVGLFRLGTGMRPGTRVRSGDVVGIVDVLGVPQEVTAPVDAIVMHALVEDDQAVEYGQSLVELERASGDASNPFGGGVVAVPIEPGAGSAEGRND